MSDTFERFKPFRFWCKTTLPLVYDESLSYYELLCKVIAYLNQIGETENELINAFLELKDWCENYLESTNFEQMVSDKLDEMAKDGTLASLINDEILANKVDKTEFDENMNRIETEQTQQNDRLTVLESKVGDNKYTGNTYYLSQFGRIFAKKLRGSDIPYLFQGGVVCNDGYAVLCVRTNTDTVVDLYKVNLMTGSYTVHTYSQNFGHANGIAFNPDKNLLTIVDTENTMNFFEVSYPNMNYVRSVPNESQCTWIWYNDDEHQYYGGQSTFVVKLDSETYKETERKSFVKPIAATGQTGMVIDGVFYHLNYSPNCVIMYNYYTGEVIKQLHFNNRINNQFNAGEPEWIDYHDGKFYVGCNDNGYDTSKNPVIHRFCTFDPVKNIQEGSYDFDMGNRSAKVYVSGDFIFNPDGSETKPFSTIREAANLALTRNYMGIEIYTTKNITEEYPLYFGGGYYYSINVSISDPTTYMNGDLYLSSGARLTAKNLVFNNAAKITVNPLAKLWFNTGGDTPFQNSIDITVEAGATFVTDTTTINAIFKNGANKLTVNGGAVLCSNTNWPISSRVMDTLPTMGNKATDLNKNFYIPITEISNASPTFAPKWFPNVFYMRVGDETFTIMRNTTSTTVPVELTGSNYTANGLQIKQISFKMNDDGITGFKYRVYTSFTEFTEPSNAVVVLY